MKALILVLAFAVFAGIAGAQETPVIRVFVAESQAQAFNADGFSATGGSNDQTVEIQKNLQERDECAFLRVTSRISRAHFVVAMDRTEGGLGKRLWGAASRDNKIAVFDGYGDLIFSTSTRSLGNAVKDSCNAIQSEIDAGRVELITVAEADASQ